MLFLHMDFAGDYITTEDAYYFSGNTFIWPSTEGDLMVTFGLSDSGKGISYEMER